MISKEILKEVMLENQEEIMAHQIIKRDVKIDDFSNYVLVGVRRCGKSFILYDRIQQLLKEGYGWDEIVYINFEDERLDGMLLEDLNTILEVHGSLSNKKPMLFLDEIQIIDGWEKFVRRLSDNKYKVVVTGSNSKMLSLEVASKLGGRFIIKEIYPFSFNEFLRAHGLNEDLSVQLSTTKGRSAIMSCYESYFLYGGFPECIGLKSKRDYLLSLFQKVYVSDIAIRNNIENIRALRVLFKKIAESIKQPISITRLTNIISSMGVKVGKSTTSNYIEYAKDAYLLLGVSNINDGITEQTSNQKYYMIDGGIISLLTIDARTSLLENIVAIDLIRKYGKEDAVFYYNKNIEIDFYVPDQELAIQVSYSISESSATYEREISALLKLSKFLPTQRLVVITYDEEKTISYGDKTIEVIPAWKWLLSI